MNSTEIGGQVLGELAESKNQFDFTNTFAKDKNGNDMKNVLSFAKSQNGGGEIHAGALIADRMQEGEKLESTAHELFHGYQYEKGQTMNGSMRTVNNEVGAYLFGRAVYYSYEMEKEGYGDMPWGNSTASGKAYQNAMGNLIKSQIFNSFLYNEAVHNFISGSAANVSKTNIPGMGIYTINHFKIDPTITNPLIKTFFPLVR